MSYDFDEGHPDSVADSCSRLKNTNFGLRVTQWKEKVYHAQTINIGLQVRANVFDWINGNFDQSHNYLYSRE